MSNLHYEIRRGAYHDSIVLMQLQAALVERSGVEDAGVVMGTRANLELLAESDLLPKIDAAGDDLVIVVRASDAASGEQALGAIDELLARREQTTSSDFQPRSFDSALRLAPDARWVLISVPGSYAADVARKALAADRHVFLYSDNVSIEEEVELKRIAAERGLLVMGPDCGTAIVGGYGLGFANRVTAGKIGLIAASGTGLQAISTAVESLGAGISHALGTGGRDLSDTVEGSTFRQAIDLLARDESTEVIVLVSKPPSARVTTSVLSAAGAVEKPVVVAFLGYVPPGRRRGNLHFAVGLEDAARMAVDLVSGEAPAQRSTPSTIEGDLRGLFAGGTLCYEAQQVLRSAISPIRSNVPILDSQVVEDSKVSRGHTLLDLGADEFTVGRPHPMIDQDLRIRRMRQEAEDPATGLLLLDVVLGDGAHPDPASELAPVIAEIRSARELPIVVMIVGGEGDPQAIGEQKEALEAAGAEVFLGVDPALDRVIDRMRSAPERSVPAVAIDALQPRAAINVGLDIFSAALTDQGLRTVHVDWRPPAGGDEELAKLLAKMK